jgi:hypothetical protein
MWRHSTAAKLPPLPKAASTYSLRRTRTTSERASRAKRDRDGADGDGDVDGAETQQDDDAERQQQRGHRQHGVDQTHDRRVGPAAARAGDQAEQGAQQQADADGDEGAGQRLGRAVDDARVEVAAHAVGAQHVLAAGRAQLLAGHALDAAEAGEQPGRDRPQEGDGDDQPGQHQADRHPPQPRQPAGAAARVGFVSGGILCQPHGVGMRGAPDAHVAMLGRLARRGSSTG